MAHKQAGVYLKTNKAFRVSNRIGVFFRIYIVRVKFSCTMDVFGVEFISLE